MEGIKSCGQPYGLSGVYQASASFRISIRFHRIFNLTPFILKANEYAEKYAKNLNGKPMIPNNEVLFGLSTTAHILGSAVMGKD